jgi:citrate/tricarballylate utilization protein
VFQAMENRTAFAKGDILYLSNLCHNCGECLYACQYAPPHEFNINVPRVMAEARVASYEEYCWPRSFAACRHAPGVAASFAGSLFFAWLLRHFVQTPDARGDFYAAIPHDDMVSGFGVIGVFVLLVLVVGAVRAIRSFGPRHGGHHGGWLRDVLTLRHLHATGADCTSDVEERTPWRRYFHHATFYGFGLCFASTTVAAIYHIVFGWRAPYAYTSVPVVLGTLGGVGLVVGPLGLLIQRRRRDPQLGDPSQRDLDVTFIAMLTMTSLTGLALLAFRASAAMTPLLLVHLGFVIVLFVTLPYGKFVHGIYRTIALLKFSAEAHR